ncbi:Gx transporter family protein [candidate division KSB1 bacterium]|nr:Gx transporter family protein [candidate division KSB1 bacterium]
MNGRIHEMDSRNRSLVWLSLLITMGLILFMFEAYIPRPLPWLKPGLANISTLLALYLFNTQAALLVVIVRVVLGSLLVGTFLNPAFILAIGGGIMATLVMSFFKRYFAQTFSILGISIFGALTHNVVQLLLVYVIIVKHKGIFNLLPLLIISALFSGIIVAVITHYLLAHFSKSKGNIR